MQKYSFINVLRTEEKDQLVKFLPCKCEVPSSIPSTPRSPVQWYVSVILVMGRQISELPGQLTQLLSSGFSERLPQRLRWRAMERDP